MPEITGTQDDRRRPGAVVRALLLVAGGLLLAVALGYDPRLLGWLRDEALSPLIREKATFARGSFAAVGLLLLGAGELLRRAPGLASRVELPAFSTTALVVVSVALPLGSLDCALRPFAEPKTRLFEADPELGWRLRPGVRAEWGGVLVKINDQGLRGRAPLHPKPAHTSRILFLGDSVTFGYGIAEDSGVFPSLVSERLSRERGESWEAVNAGVGGYSPWQELRYLECCGWRHEPDLVVVNFVLNDVTEKLHLEHFGGSSRGWQLMRSASGSLDRWLSASAVASALRDAYARLRFGRDVVHGAQLAEAAEVRVLVADPEIPELRRAWRITFENLARIFAAARERRVPIALVVFPYSFQLDAPSETDAVQRKLTAFAEARGVPVLDLLPTLKASEADPFLDPNHLSAEGHRVVAEAIAAFAARRGLLTPEGT